MDIDC